MRHALRTVLVLALVGGGVFAYRFCEERWVARNLGVVEPRVIYRSGQIHGGLIRGVLEERGIAVVVNLQGEEPDNPDQVAEGEAIAALGIRSFRYPMGGNGVGTVETYAQAVARLAEAEKSRVPTLIHCAAGSQRTGGTVAAFRLLVQGGDPQAAYDEARSYDWDPDDDTAWPKWLNENMGEIAARLVELGAIENVPGVLPIFGRLR